jgi:hypothetical protein
MISMIVTHNITLPSLKWRRTRQNETMMMMRLLTHLLLLTSSSVVLSFTHPHATTTALGNGADTTTSLHGVRSSLRRVRDSVLSRERTDKDLKDGIAFFYDRSSKVWEDVWGKKFSIRTILFSIDVLHCGFIHCFYV